MKYSPARLAANRANSLKSTGPRTQAGREASRQNSFKHGLTGGGVVLPGEDREAIDRRFRNLGDEFDPQTEREFILLQHACYQSVRLDRCRRHDMAMLSTRVRHAIENFHQERLDALNASITRLDREPELVIPHLKRDPDGLDWLVEQWETLRRPLTEGDGRAFGITEVATMVNLMGERFDSSPKPREAKLHEAIGGYFGNLDPADRDAVPDEAKPEWARGLLLGMIDRELSDVKGARDAFDIADLKADQDEARDRVLFDPSKEAILARRYEAATERSLKKTFRELDELAAIKAEATPVVAEAAIEQELASNHRGSLASFFPIGEIPSEVEESRPISPAVTEMIASSGLPKAELGVSLPRIE